MPIDKIINDESLYAILRNDISENGISVGISSNLFVAPDCLNSEVVAILKLDSFFAYNSQDTHNPPKAVDYLVVVKCCDGSMRLYLIELRKAEGKKKAKRLSSKEILGKFQTIATDFFPRFPEIFNPRNVKKVTAHLVTDPWKQKDKAESGSLFEKKAKLSVLDNYSSLKPISILGHNVMINPILPPNPIIEPC